MYNIDPQIKALEKEIERLRAKCDLLGIKVRASKRVMYSFHSYAVLHISKYPEHGYDPWMFEREFLQRTLGMYFTKPKRLI